MAISKNNSHQSASHVAERLMAALQVDASRSTFFKTVSQIFQEYFHFDRLCINLYDREGGMLTYFTAAEGTLVSTLSPVRPAESSSTVAGHVIASRKPVIFTDVAQHFSESDMHPIAEAGLTSTMAFPLMLDNEIFATLHCSFAHKPDNLYEIASFVTDLCPAVATCLGSILSREQFVLQQKRLHATYAPPVEEPFVYHSRLMKSIMRRVDANAKLDVPILILGESGTGKTVIAHEVHRRSHRRENRFIKVSCPSLPSSLFESELFGHSRGAFTGAGTKRTGRVELAHKGTLFLDEIAELSVEMQSKLLQVLEESSFERVGESMSTAVDVRFVAATNVNVADAIARGALRHDLFYRLATCVIEIPPLRQHKEDIPTLVTAIARQVASRLHLPVLSLRQNFLGMLMAYNWPGNVRELRNIVTRLSILNGTGSKLTEKDIREVLHEANYQERLSSVSRALPLQSAGLSPGPLTEPTAATSAALPPSSAAQVGGTHAGLVQAGPHAGTTSPASHPSSPESPHWTSPGAAPSGPSPTVFKTPLDVVETLAEVERKHIIKVLQRTGGIVAGPHGAAALLGVPRSTLQHRMRKLGIECKTTVHA